MDEVTGERGARSTLSCPMLVHVAALRAYCMTTPQGSQVTIGLPQPPTQEDWDAVQPYPEDPSDPLSALTCDPPSLRPPTGVVDIEASWGELDFSAEDTYAIEHLHIDPPLPKGEADQWETRARGWLDALAPKPGHSFAGFRAGGYAAQVARLEHPELFCRFSKLIKPPAVTVQQLPHLLEAVTAGRHLPRAWSYIVDARAAMASDPARAVIDLATANEMAYAEHIRIGPLLPDGGGRPEKMVSGLYKKVKEARARTMTPDAGIDLDTVSKQLGKVRNNAVHDGIVPTWQQAEQAYEVAWALLDAVQPLFPTDL